MKTNTNEATLVPSYRDNDNDTRDSSLEQLWGHVTSDQKTDYACPWNRLRQATACP